MAIYEKERMTVDDLESVHALYSDYHAFWDFLLACYEGIRAMVEGGHAIYRHERESRDNYNRRIKDIYGFGYSESVVNLFNFYLFKNPAKRDMGILSEDKQWSQFERDCNLYGDDFLVWLLESQRWAGVLGHVGILVDKSSNRFQTAEEELNYGVYPYVCRYFPQNILDWDYGRDINNRPYLKYIKLKDSDGLYTIWTSQWWAKFRIPEDAPTKTTVKDVDTGEIRGVQVNTSGEQVVTAEAYGDNPFYDDRLGRGEIPFVFLYNIKSKDRPIGISDIKEVSYIDRSIVTNLSEGEEVITYGAFPLMRKPMREVGSGASGRGAIDDTGPSAILEFDPTLPESKPDWLEAAVEAPIGAILDWVHLKVQEIYRVTNAGGMAATEIQTQARSGTALKSEFQLLNGKLVAKGNNCQEAELNIKRYWCMWQNRLDAYETLAVEWPESYDVADLAEDLANMLTAKTIVASQAFAAAVEKQVVRAVLPNAQNTLLAEIDQEIDDRPDTEPLNMESIEIPNENIE